MWNRKTGKIIIILIDIITKQHLIFTQQIQPVVGIKLEDFYENHS